METANDEVLLPAEAARRIGVATRDIVRAMHEKRIPRVRLEDGTLGIPASALERFKTQA
ncbi:MAG TPA: hypothetical protein VJM33_18735 [Microthrixaceae bacterium]|nr:hypothetical protein [Microthrixaceae bacterium]